MAVVRETREIREQRSNIATYFLKRQMILKVKYITADSLPDVQSKNCPQVEGEYNPQPALVALTKHLGDVGIVPEWSPIWQRSHAGGPLCDDLQRSPPRH